MTTVGFTIIGIVLGYVAGYAIGKLIERRYWLGLQGESELVPKLEDWK